MQRDFRIVAKKKLKNSKNKLNNIKKNAFFNKCQTQP